ncbi:MAG TPA: phytoene/squalene synthase family protein [Propionicimonas sp.]|nr:phytoene/squalene synthase family protein [Propionicimonas sp.]HQA77377.1 phytoene/squalene synthase family protein [Propionicimonas sp.]HQD97149.1 phytoene/squalene synthase family protein [Propionicimonas sp.]
MTELAAGYAECARLTREYGTTYYWGALLLPKARRRHVYAIYALCRLADDVVDAPGATTDRTPETRAALAGFQQRFEAALAGSPDDAVMAAIAASVTECGIDPECFDRFFSAMAMDLDVDRYENWADLCAYMEGSAAVIGEMMLPVLQPASAEAREPARALGFAFQLTNFLRDVNEDLDRGRVYLPQADLARFGASPWHRLVDEPWRRTMALLIARNRELYAQARTGIPLLPSRSARCVATALTLYSQILDRIERNDYDVFSGRLRVPTWRKAATALTILATGPRLAKAPALGGQLAS